jgi:hypothetical protein
MQIKWIFASYSLRTEYERLILTFPPCLPLLYTLYLSSYPLASLLSIRLYRHPPHPLPSPLSGINRPTGGSGNKAGILNEVRSQYINKCGDSSPGPLDLSPWALDSLPSSCLLTSEVGVLECVISG